MAHETNEPMSGMFDPLGGLRGTGLIVPAHDHSEPMIHDLAQHLAYHASVGFCECRDMEPVAVPAVIDDGRTEGLDREFIVDLHGRRFSVTIEEIVA